MNAADTVGSGSLEPTVFLTIPASATLVSSISGAAVILPMPSDALLFHIFKELHHFERSLAIMHHRSARICQAALKYGIFKLPRLKLNDYRFSRHCLKNLSQTHNARLDLIRRPQIENQYVIMLADNRPIQ